LLLNDASDDPEAGDDNINDKTMSQADQSMTKNEEDPMEINTMAK
jgi:hypothetical protein